MTLAPLTSLGLVSSHTNLLATGQRRYAIKRGLCFAKAKHNRSRKPALSEAEGDPLCDGRRHRPRKAFPPRPHLLPQRYCTLSPASCNSSPTLLIPLNSPARRNSGKIHAHIPIPTSVPPPPNKTAGTVPNHCAVSPDSNCPNSFEVPIKTISTAITRPRISSGVRSCTSVARIITLTMSAAPKKISDNSDITKLVDTPNKIVHIPNPATDHSSVGPAFPRSGRCASAMAVKAAPTPGAVRSNPNPHGPVCRISRA